MKVSEAKVAQAQAAVTAAEAEAQRAADDLKRYESVESRAVSKSAFDLAQAQARSANADLEAARSQAKAAEAEVALERGGRGNRRGRGATGRSQSPTGRTESFLHENHRAAWMRASPPARCNVGNYVQPGQALLALVPTNVWVTANFKETQLTYMRPGQPVELSVDAYPDRNFKGRVDSLQAGTGARFSLLPPENAVGNYVKVVQRVPVKIVFDETAARPTWTSRRACPSCPKVKVK